MSPETLRGVLRLALAAEGGIDAVLHELVGLADVCAREHARADVKAVLETAEGLLRASAADSGSRLIMLRSLSVGRKAGQMGLPELARTIYLLAREQLNPAADRHSIGMLHHEIGDTWKAQGKGSAAIAAYRAAVDGVAGDDNRLAALGSLARAESKWGTRSAAQAALSRAAQIIERRANVDRPDIDAILRTAVELGRTAESLRFPELARGVYEVAQRRLDPVAHSHAVGALWNEIGDTWKSERKGEEALAAYRAASACGDVRTRTIALSSLADAEATWGSTSASREALIQAIGILDAQIGNGRDDLAGLSSIALTIARTAEGLSHNDISDHATRVSDKLRRLERERVVNQGVERP